MNWQIGTVKVSKVVELEGAATPRFILPQATPEEILRLPWLVPEFATESGRFHMSVHSYVVDTGSQRIVIDTGIGNDRTNRAFPAWNELQTPYLERLEVAGYRPESIDKVICTHLHIDHIGWNTRLVDGKWEPTFPNAHYYFVDDEYAYWSIQAEDAEMVFGFRDSIKPIVDAGKARLVPADHDFGDGISLVPAPGHSPAQVAILVKSGDESGLFTGDIVHHPCQLTHLDWASTVDFNPGQGAQSRRAIFSRFADTPTIVFAAHFVKAGRLHRTGDAYRFAPIAG